MFEEGKRFAQMSDMTMSEAYKHILQPDSHAYFERAHKRWHRSRKHDIAKGLPLAGAKRAHQKLLVVRDRHKAGKHAHYRHNRRYQQRHDDYAAYPRATPYDQNWS